MNAAKGHVLVTGAAIRIGRTIALTLAKAGWDVTIHSFSSHEAAKTLARDIEGLGRNATLAQANLENLNEVDALIKTDPDYPLTALVNNASLFEHDTDDQNGARHDMVNNQVPRLLTERLLAQLPPDVTGAVVHLLDATPIPASMSAYAASRARLREDIPALALRYAHRLRINAVAPGPTLINPRQSMPHFEKMVADTPLGLPSSPESIAQAVLFLLETPSITGQILTIDSGTHLFL